MLAAKHGESVSTRTFHPPLTQGVGPSTHAEKSGGGAFPKSHTFL